MNKLPSCCYGESLYGESVNEEYRETINELMACVVAVHCWFTSS